MIAPLTPLNLLTSYSHASVQAVLVSPNQWCVRIHTEGATTLILGEADAERLAENLRAIGGGELADKIEEARIEVIKHERSGSLGGLTDSGNEPDVHNP